MRAGASNPGRLAQAIHRWFPDRQLLIRGPDNISALKFTRRRQVVLVCLLAAAVLWLTGASLFTAFSLMQSGRTGLLIVRLELKHQEDQAKLVAIGIETARIAEQRDIAVAQANAARDQAVARADQARDRAMAAAAASTASGNAKVGALIAQTQATIGQVETVIKSTGLDPEHLSHQGGAPLPLSQSALAGLVVGGVAPPLAVQLGSIPASSFVQVAPATATRTLPVVITPAGPADGPDGLAPPAAAGPPVSLGPKADRTALLMTEIGQLQSLTNALARMPISAPLAKMSISSPFGFRPDPWTGAREFHVGVDFRGPMDTPVYATAPGVVTYAGVSTGYGNLVVIDHGYGLSTRYSHLERILVVVGTAVDLHQQIGLLGNTGWSTGPHLLYETRVDGQPRNPLNFIKVNPYDVQN